MKKLLILAGCAMMLALSCAKEKDAPELRQKGGLFYAAIEDVDSKVFADDQLRVLWHQNDLVSIFNKYTYNKQYKFNGNTGDNAGSFSEVPSSDFVTGNTLPLVYAIYPYNEGTSISNDGVISLNFPAAQSYSKNSFGIGANPMVSVSEDNNLLFKNVGGYLMLKFYGEACIKTIQLQATQKIAGAATVTMDLGGTPVIAMADNASTKITLDCGEGILVGATEENYTEFWFALPPVSFLRGFTVKITDVYGQTFTKKTTNALTISRNHLEKMAPIELNMPHQSSSDNIVFADASVKSWLVRKFDTNHDGELSFAEAAAVTSEQMFACFDCSSGSDKEYPDPPIKTFNEMKYFTGLTSVPEACFLYCSDLEEVTLPPGIESISAYAFEGCTSLKALDVPAACKRVVNQAFTSCWNLKTLIFRSPDYLDLNYLCFGLTGMCNAETLIIYAEQAFDPGMHYSGAANGNGLKVAGTIYVPAKSIVRYQELWHQMEKRIKPIPETFDDIITFADPNVRDWIIKWEGMDGCFDQNGDGEISYREAAAITELPPNWFDPTHDFSIGNAPAITSFDEFEYFYGLGTVDIACFFNCKSLTSIRIPRSVGGLCEYAFYGCEGLTEFVGPRNMTYLGTAVFCGCTNLKNITLYGDSMFFNWASFGGLDLETLTLYATSLPTFGNTQVTLENHFRDLVNSVQTVYVPDPSLYRNDANWGSYAAVGQYAQIPDYETYYRTHY